MSNQIVGDDRTGASRLIWGVIGMDAVGSYLTGEFIRTIAILACELLDVITAP